MNVLPETSKGGSFNIIDGPLYREATLSCGEGYKLPAIITTKFVNGVWNPPKLDCIPLSDLRELPVTGDGGNVTSTSQPPYHFNDEATLNCDLGYSYPNTHTSKVVVENGVLKWKPPELHCNPVLCFPPPEIQNGKLDPNKSIYQFTNSVKYVCHPGFVLQAYRAEFWCSASGQWQPPITPENIKCVQDPEWCPELKAPQNGSLKLSNGRHYGSVASFACDQGFRLTGGIRTCQEDRTWSGEEISCAPPLACPEMDAKSVTFFVNDTFNLVVCDSALLKVRCINGQWEYKHPYCDKIKNISQPGPVSNPRFPANKMHNTSPPTVNTTHNISHPTVNKTHHILPSPPIPIPPVSNVLSSPVPTQMPVHPVPNVKKQNSLFSFTIWILLVALSVIVIFLAF